MKLWQQLIILTGISLLSGCGLLTGFGTDNTPAPQPLPVYQPSSKIKTLWSTQVGAGSEKSYLRLLAAYQNGYLFTADHKGNVVAIDAKQGRQIWHTNIKTAITTGPVVADDLLVVGTQDGHALALNPNKGEILWRTTVSDEILAPPTISDADVLIKSIDGTFTAIDKQSGAIKWTYDHGAPLMVLRASSMTKVATQDNQAYIGFSDGHLTAVDFKRQTILWDQTIAAPKSAAEIDQLVDIAADPIIRGNVLYTVTYQGQVAALNLSNGEILWQQNSSSYAGMVVSTNYVVVIDTDSTITAFNRHNGKVAWQQHALQYRNLGTPALFDNTLIVGDGQGYLHLLDVNDGHLRAQLLIKKDQSIIAAPALDASTNTVYTLTTSGLLTALYVQ